MSVSVQLYSGGLVATAAVAGAVAMAAVSVIEKERVLSVSGGGRKRRKLDRKSVV
jgi:hypothetical protein